MNEEKNVKKIKLSTAVLLFVIFILILALIGLVVYYNSLNKKQKVIKTNEVKNNQTSLSENLLDNSVENAISENIIDDNVENAISENIINNNEDTIVSKTPSNNIEVKKLDINNDLIKRLYEYILRDCPDIEKIVYQNQKITVDKMSDELKLATILSNLSTSEADRKEIKEQENYYYSKNTVEKKAKQIFGDRVKIKHGALAYDKRFKDLFFVNGGDIFEYKNGEYLEYRYGRSS